MAHMLRAVAKLKLAQSIMIGSVALVALGVAGGVSAPVLINMGTNVVTEVKDLQDEYPVTYGGKLDLSQAKIHIGNAFDSTGQWIDGSKFTVEGYDENFIGPQDVTLTYLNFKKVIKVTTAPKKLVAPAPTFNFTTGVLSWEPVQDATFYTVYLRNPETKTAITNYNAEGTSYDFNSIAFFSQFETYVVSGSDKKGSNGVSAFTPSDESKSILLRKISNVSDIHYDISDGKFKWTGVNDASGYDVRINGTTFSPTVPEIAFDTSNPGDYNISIRSIGPNAGVDYATPVEATIRRMPTPKVSLVNGALAATDGENLVWYRDGVEFTGDVKTITNVGSYSITAKNKARTAKEIDSAMSEPLVLTKIGAPQISLTNGHLSYTNVGSQNAVQYYLDGKEWDAKLDKITEVGDHAVTARAIGNTNEITSELSNSVTVTKLSAPTLSFDGKNFSFTDADPTSFAIYEHGVKKQDLLPLSEEKLNAQPAGTYIVYGVNEGNGNDILASDRSNIVSFLIPNITCDEPTISENPTLGTMANFVLHHSIPNVTSNLKAEVDVKWLQGGEGGTVLHSYHYTDWTVFAPGATVATRGLTYNLTGKGKADRIEFKITKVKVVDGQGKELDIQVFERTYDTVAKDNFA